MGLGLGLDRAVTGDIHLLVECAPLLALQEGEGVARLVRVGVRLRLRLRHRVRVRVGVGVGAWARVWVRVGV